jgi:phosphohistidine phosphatase
MDLTILRHGIAVGRNPGVPDGRRELTPKGAKKIHGIAHAMRALSLTFDLILTSPLLRARQTAEIVAEELDMAHHLEVTPLLLPETALRELIDEIRLRKRESVLLVGHEPALSRLVSLLLAGGEDMAVTIKKGGMCRLVVSDLRHGRCATLDWLMTPAQLLLMD